MLLFHRQLFIYCLILPILFIIGCSVTQELTELTTETEYNAYIDRYAPAEDAFVTVQRLAKPFIDRNDWEKAIAVFEKYKSKFPLMGSRFDKIIQLLQAPQSKLRITNLGTGINSQFDEIKPTPTADGTRMYFASKDRPDGFGGLDIYVSKFENEKWGPAQNLGPNINSKEHESINSISADGTRICLYGAFEGHMGRGDNFYFEKTPQGWSRIKVFPPPINSIDWDSDGFFTADGKAFLFTSDREGVIGERHPKGDPDLKQFPYHGSYGGNTDIFVCIKQGYGWSEPINLGPTINTPYCERSPFLHPDGKTLYFSSDGHYGLGRLDVFKSVRLRDDVWTEWSAPVNLGKDINTSDDDWGYKVSTDGETSFFSAGGKMGGYGGSDIYSIGLPKEVQPEEKVITVSGIALDENGNPVKGNGTLNIDDLYAKNGKITDQNGNQVLTNGLNWDDINKRRGKVFDANGNQVNNSGLNWDDIKKNKWKVTDENGNPMDGTGNLSWKDMSLNKWKIFDENGNLIDKNNWLTWDDLNNKKWKAVDQNGKPFINGGLSWDDINTKNWKVVDENGKQINEKGFIDWDEMNRRRLKMYDESGNLIDKNSWLTWNDLFAKKWNVFDGDGNQINGNAKIRWEDLDSKKQLGELQVDPQTGEFSIPLALGKNYSVYLEAEGYYPDSKKLDLRDRKDPRNIKLNFNLNSILVMKNKRDKWGDLFAQRVNNIFFDFDKYELRPESSLELDRLARFLETNPTIRIQIGAHTDSVGTDDYNMRLSQKRAQSVVNYLISQKVSTSRLEAKGYGKTRPLVDNNTEEGRAQNRRVEFRIAE